MAYAIYMKLKGQSGELKGAYKNDDANKKESIQVLALDHTISVPPDPGEGFAKGRRRHRPLTITKEVDKTTPLLLKALCASEKFTEVTLYWYNNPDGTEKYYFTTKLENARIVAIRTWFPNSNLQTSEEFGHMEEVSFSYSKITWTFEDGGITGDDDAEHTPK